MDEFTEAKSLSLQGSVVTRLPDLHSSKPLEKFGNARPLMPVRSQDDLERGYWLIFVEITKTCDRRACGRRWDDECDWVSEGRSVLRRRRAVFRWFWDMHRMQTVVLVSWFIASGCRRTGNLNPVHPEGRHCVEETNCTPMFKSTSHNATDLLSIQYRSS